MSLLLPATPTCCWCRRPIRDCSRTQHCCSPPSLNGKGLAHVVKLNTPKAANEYHPNVPNLPFKLRILMVKNAWICVTLAFGVITSVSLPSPQSMVPSPDRLVVSLTTCCLGSVKTQLRCGVWNVFENRQARQGRMLPLKIVLIPALHPHRDQGPIFYMAGGPGETATELASLMIE